MVDHRRLTASPDYYHYLWAIAGLCALYGSSASAVVLAKPKNGSSLVNQTGGVQLHRQLRPDRLETSQTRVDPVQQDGSASSNGYRASSSSSSNRVSSKDYDGGGGGAAGSYQVQNTYGPPRDYYYDELPDYYRPHHQATAGGHHHQFQGSPEVIYHQHPPAQVQPYPYDASAGNGGPKPGQLDIQPLLWPLAGITLLGVLTALVKTPLLLHLGTVGRRRRRRRRDLQPREWTVTADTIESLLDKFNDKGQRINLKACLVCDVVASIYSQKSACVERSICEVMSQNEPNGPKMDKRLLTAMIAQVTENDQIPEEFKKRLESAEVTGRSGGNCERLYPCDNDEDRVVAPEMVLK